MQSQNTGTQPELAKLEYEVWQDFIWQRSGLYFTENRVRFLSQRLWERMRIHKMKTYSEYYHYVAFNPSGNKEWIELLELLLNNETGFFRHQPSFDALSEHVLPELKKHKRKHGIDIITMWSAGCSAGQEAYSLAMTSLSTPDTDQWQVKVTGSDISQGSLEKARRGRYRNFELRYLPELYQKMFLKKLQDGSYQVVDRVRALVQFGYLNLSDPSSYWVSAEDVIFCQNVLIYFKPESRLEIVRRLCQRLNPGGYLFLAPAEVVGLKLPGIQAVRFTDSLVYQRIQ